MAKVSLKTGTTSYLARIFIQDSSSTTGAGLTGLTNASSGLVCYRARDDDGNAGGTAISLASATLGTWTSAGFKEKDATNMPGVYEFGVPNAAIAAGSKSVLIMFKGATNMAPLALEIELTAVDNQDGVRAGLTALPNAAAEASGGLYTRGTGAGQINQDANGRIDANMKALLGTAISTPATAGIMDVNTIKVTNTAQTARDLGASVLLTAAESGIIQSGIAAAGAGSTITIATALGADSLPNGCIIKITSGTGVGQSRVVTGYVNSTKVVTVGHAWTTNPDNTSVYAIMFADSAKVDSNLKVAGVVLADTLTTYTSNTPQTGDNFARLGAPAGASVSADIAAAKVDTAAIKAKTDNLPASPASTTNITAGTIATVSGNVNGSVGSVTAPVSLTAAESKVVQSGTATAGAASTITIQTALGANSLPNGCLIKITSGTGIGQSRIITGYVDSTKVVTVGHAWTTVPDATSVYSIEFADAPKIDSNLKVSGVVLVDTTTTNTDMRGTNNAALASTLGTPAGATIAADVAGVQADTDDIQTRLPAALTANGNMKSSLVEILTTALTETAGLLAGGFKKFFNVASPTMTALGVNQTGDNYARLGAPAGASVSADIAAIQSDTTAIKAKTDNLPAAPASTTNITGGVITTVTNLTNAPTAGDFTAAMKSSLNAATPTISLSAGDSPVLQSGTATAGGATSITIQTAIGADSRPVGCIIKITGGTGAGQARGITAYVDSTKVITVDRAWATNPDATSVYSILYAEVPKLDSNLKIAGVVLADTATNLTNAPTNGDLTATMKASVTTSATASTPTIAGYTGNTPQTGDAFSRLGAPAGASISADVAGVQSDTTNIKTRIPAALTANGNIKSSLMEILTTALTETAGQIAGGFKKFFNIGSPAATMDHGILMDTVTTYTGNTVQTGDAFARLGAPAGASHAADVAAVKALLPAALVSGRMDSSVGAMTAGAAQSVWDVAESTVVAAASIGLKLKNTLPQRITKNTALVAFPFTMVLSSDHVSSATGLTVTATRSLDGGSFAACANVVTEVGGGVYVITLAAADLNGNTVVLSFAAATADTRQIIIITEPAAA